MGRDGVGEDWARAAWRCRGEARADGRCRGEARAGGSCRGEARAGGSCRDEAGQVGVVGVKPQNTGRSVLVGRQVAAQRTELRSGCNRSDKQSADGLVGLLAS